MLLRGGVGMLGGSLMAVVHAASGLVANGLFDFLGVSHVDRQLAVVVPRIQVRPVAHEQHRDLQMTTSSSIVEGGRTVVIGLVSIGTLL